MLNITKIKSTKGLSAFRLPKIERIKVSINRSEYAGGSIKSFTLTTFFNLRKQKPFCVYILWIGHEIVYVGQSLNVFKRLQSHKKQIKYTHASIMNLPNVQTMNDVEIALIKKHKPRFNKKHNPNYDFQDS